LLWRDACTGESTGSLCFKSGAEFPRTPITQGRGGIMNSTTKLCLVSLGVLSLAGTGCPRAAQRADDHQELRQERRDDRQDNREERRDDRQERRDEY
jgi:hypothetical protein